MRALRDSCFVLLVTVAACGGSTSTDFAETPGDAGAADTTTSDAPVSDTPGSDAPATDAPSPDVSADAPDDTTASDVVGDSSGVDVALDVGIVDGTADVTPEATAVDATGDTTSDAVTVDAPADVAADTTAPACLTAGECPGFPSTWVDDATAVANCAGAEHQIDCCGARRVFGINHGVRTTFCPAETACRATYPAPPGCTDASITTDTGETTTNIADVRVRCVGSSGSTCLCQTFVCTDSSCMASSGPIGGCGP